MPLISAFMRVGKYDAIKESFTVGSEKKFGGNAKKGMNGKLE